MKPLFPMLLCLVLSLAGCGGGGGGGSSSSSDSGDSSSDGGTTTSTYTANVMSITVDDWSTTYPNQPMVSVTVCASGTSTCQTIDHVLLDTGSYGFRVMASVLNADLATAFNAQTTTLTECTQFLSGYTWGPVRQADLTLGSEAAVTTPIQVMDDSYSPSAPFSCSAGLSSMNTVATFGANGVLGVGPFAQDCGSACVSSAISGAYYDCTSGTCKATTVALASQVQNPVALLATDNNGVLVDLPSVASGGQATATGSLILGIGTQDNNTLGSATVYTLDSNYGTLSTSYNGRTMAYSFFDTGSNGLFFDDSSIPSCSSGFYCPTSTLSLSATITSAASVSTSISFTVANADSLSYPVSAELAGPIGSSYYFDWGLPFFYGRKVFTAIEGMSAPGGTAPYIAF